MILDPAEYLNLILSILAIIPIVILSLQYRATRIVDYLIFAGFFGWGAIGITFDVVAKHTDSLIIYQIQFYTFFLMDFFIFLYAIRIHWERPPRLLWYIVVIWFLFMTLLILFWEKFQQPSYTTLFIFDIPHSPSTYHPNGAGIKLSEESVLFSTSYYLLITLNSIFSILLLLYVYVKIIPIQQSPKIGKARKLWISSGILYLVYQVGQLPWIPNYQPLILIILIGLILMSYIAISIPEGLLISHTQVLRANKLYKRIKSSSFKSYDIRFPKQALIDYMQSLPSEIFDQSIDEKNH
ncbi:MAG: hypothetical protein IH840_05000 [Candidatus Heimdallarchaeota archaeon]|nr:hypothetical protein [Candidatus Heimdallarchaeota archaeon]